MTTDRPTAPDVVAAIRAARFTYASEDALQAGLSDALEAADVPHVREAQLGRGYGRIDLLAGHVGIEVKVAGSLAAVVRQLDRYARHPDITHLVLITTVAQHRGVPPVLHDCPVTLFDLARHQAF